jgi:hypothetical protein
MHQLRQIVYQAVQPVEASICTVLINGNENGIQIGLICFAFYGRANLLRRDEHIHGSYSKDGLDDALKFERAAVNAYATFSPM